MTREEFQPGVRFCLKGERYIWYRVHKAGLGDMYITRKGGSRQGQIKEITDEGITVVIRIIGHVATAVIPFDNLDVMPDRDY